MGLSHAARSPLVIWRLLDGKPGHENQTAGLVRALAERWPVNSYDIAIRPHWRHWLALLLAKCPQGDGLPDPDMLLGAGHATHSALLACRRARGGRSVVLMRPSLPMRWFDLCVVPEHDGLASRPGVFISRGVLNAVKRTDEKHVACGLILIGGPSKHHDWSDDRLIEQVTEIMRRDPRAWTIATSRRTPASTIDALRALATPPVRVVEPQDEDAGWLSGQLQQMPVAWVTEDSVSMLYESLTAGAACGLIDVPSRGSSRIHRGVERLVADGSVVTFAAWRDGHALSRPAEPFNEAVRCADWIVDRWLAH